MTRTGRTLDEYVGMGAAGLVALVSFVGHLPPDSALRRDIDPRDELPDWCTSMKTNAILADLYDAYCATHAKKGRRVKPYPRPGDKKGQAIGSGAIPIRDFDAWWNSA